jgi:ribosome maturation factor RimP
MEAQAQIETIEQLVRDTIANDPGFFLVLVKIKPTNNVKVYVDGDQGITIENCIRINRALYARIDESGLFPEGDFSLEVSSPGVGEPLLLHRQYQKNIGRLLQATLTDGKQHTGILASASQEGVVLQITTGKGKKATESELFIAFADMKEASVQVKF